MNILFPVDIPTREPTNPFLWQLVCALMGQEEISHVQYGARGLEFPSEYDVVHFHWPEAVFAYKEPSRAEFAEFSEKLKKIKTKSKIVTTVHNYDPHEKFKSLGVELFDLVYSHSDAFVHLGRQSEKFFAEKYCQRPWFERAIHKVIIHGDYEFYRSESTTLRDRIRIREKEDEFVVLVFGSLRNQKEEKLARKSFAKANINNSRLVYTGRWKRSLKTNFFIRDLVLRLRSSGRLRVSRINKRVPNSAVLSIIEQADVLFVPRAGRLNSGIVALAFTFGKPVVGPSEGVIGEMLDAVGCPQYLPGDKRSASEKLAELAGMSDQDLHLLKDKITNYCELQMAWPGLARQHIELYHQLLR